MSADAVAKAQPQPVNTPGCAWIGKRTIQTLLRDDIVAANDYTTMYKTMDCPAKALAEAFSCAVAKINEGPGVLSVPGGTHDPATATAERVGAVRDAVNGCWDALYGVIPAKPAAAKPAAAKP
ncbi:MAG: hypothetical protein HQL36_10655 [Alphaproteobacteria bacterium]|nr:hypothetical protein [Alphaproteobacteria bacterium]MBF0250063.1 hypothetical protein [Alphaproteobacteria bacterium]